jgi:hypothetical protein
MVLDGCPMFASAYSGFPVGLAGVGELHAAFLNESRTRGCWWRPVQEIRIHGPKTDFSNAFTPCTRILALRRSLFARVAEALEGAAPRLFRPMYARANMGHPSREAGFVVCSRAGLLTCSSQPFLPNLVPQPRTAVSDHSINSRLESPRVR